MRALSCSRALGVGAVSSTTRETLTVASTSASGHRGADLGRMREQGPPHIPALAKDILRYFSLFGVSLLAPAVAMAKAEAAERALRLLSSSRQEVITTPLL